MKYKLIKYRSLPFYLSDMGSVPSFNVSDKFTETKEQELLWHVNKMREHDGLKPISNDDFADIIWTRDIKFEVIEES